MRGFIVPETETDGLDDVDGRRAVRRRGRGLTMAHRIGGRKLSRKQGPRLALYKNLTVSVLRYERVKTTEAQGQGDPRPGREDDHARQAGRPRRPAGAVVAAVPERAARRQQAVRRDRAQVRRPHVRATPGSSRSASAAATRPRSSSSSSSDGRQRRADAREGGPVRYRARVEYDGTDFAGFQVQPGRRTVQGELEDALARLGDGAASRVDGAGRTDAGVHATGQVIAFTCDGAPAGGGAGRGARGAAPGGLAIRDLRRGTAEFHPRYAARYREYRYTVWNGPRSPLRERTALGVRVPLDTAAMERAGSVFVGRHDFCAFGAADRSPVRTVMAVRVRRDGRLVTIDVGPTRSCGDGPAHGGRPPGGRPRTDGYDTVRSALAGPDRPSTGRPPRPRGSASGAWPSGDDRNERTENTRNDEREDLHGPGERDRATLVRRRCDGRDARPPRLAHRACPRGQAQADSISRTSTRATTSSCSTPSKIAVTQRQARAKLYSRHSGYPAGLQAGDPGPPAGPPPGGSHPPRGQGHAAAQPLGTQQLRKLKVYPGSDHPHQAQQPEPLA